MSAHSGFAERLDYAVRICLARAATPRELEWMHGYLQHEKRALAQDSESARKRWPIDASPEAGGWVALSSALLNLDEFITRE